MSFTLTIRDNETGKVRTRIDNAVAICGCVTTENDYMRSLTIAKGNAVKVLMAAEGARSAADNLASKLLNSPQGKQLMELLSSEEPEGTTIHIAGDEE